MERALINIKVISHIKEGTKLCTHGDLLHLEEPSWFRGLIRRFRGDDRERAYTTLEQTVDTLLQCMERCARNEAIDGYRRELEDRIKQAQEAHSIETRIADISTLQYIIREIEHGVAGMKSLKLTYKGDECYQAKLDRLIERVIETIQRVQTKFPLRSHAHTPSSPTELRYGLEEDQA